MPRPLRRLIAGVAVALAVLVAALLPVAPHAAAQPSAEEPRPQARAWALIDADGEVLAARAARRPGPIASATKLMTAYVARRELALGQTVTAPAYDAGPIESLLGLEPGERIRVRHLLAGLLLASGNDAAVALAEAASGSVDGFVAKMNRAAAELGLEATSFANPIGLDEPGNHSTALDLARLAIEVRRDRFLRRLVAKPRVRLRSGAPRAPVRNRNTLVRSVPWVDGIKTGHTLGAGHVLVGSGSRKGTSLVSVVLGAPSERARDSGALALLRYGFSLYRRETPVDPSREVAATSIRHRDGTVPLIPARALRVTVREEEELETRVSAAHEVEGPVERGDRLGRAVVLVDGERVGAVRLLAARDAAAATVVDRLDAAVPGSRATLAAIVAVALVLSLLLVLVVGLAVRHRRGRRRLASGA